MVDPVRALPADVRRTGGLAIFGRYPSMPNYSRSIIMALPKPRVVLFFGFAGFILIVCPFAVRSIQFLTYVRHQRATAVLIESLQERCPADVDAKIWDAATGWAITAYHNVCFSEEHVPLAELRKFRQDVEQKLQDDVDLSTVDWIWSRLEQCSPHGRQYVARFEPVYRLQVYGEPTD